MAGSPTMGGPAFLRFMKRFRFTLQSVRELRDERQSAHNARMAHRVEKFELLSQSRDIALRRIIGGGRLDDDPVTILRVDRSIDVGIGATRELFDYIVSCDLGLHKASTGDSAPQEVRSGDDLGTATEAPMSVQPSDIKILPENRWFSL